jgi:PKD repeat protein
VDYWWDLDNDGVYDNGAGATTTVTYVENGVYTVGLLVRDDDGYTETVSASIRVVNVAPVVSAGEDQVVGIGESVRLAGAGFSDEGVMDTHTATIDWGDGTTDPGAVTESGGTGTVSGTHTYSATGTYTVDVCVSDDDGESDCDSLTVVVSASAPVPIGAYLELDGQVATHSPVPAPDAPAGVVTIQATFSNISDVVLSGLFFLVSTLVDDAGVTFLYASSGSNPEAVVVPVPAAALGSDGMLEPGETFTIVFEIGLAQRQGFAFVANAYGRAPGAPANGDGAGFRFDVDPTLLLQADNTIYLPIIGR